jgi:hypothetical protein
MSNASASASASAQASEPDHEPEHEPEPTPELAVNGLTGNHIKIMMMALHDTGGVVTDPDSAAKLQAEVGKILPVVKLVSEKLGQCEKGSLDEAFFTALLEYYAARSRTNQVVRLRLPANPSFAKRVDEEVQAILNLNRAFVATTPFAGATIRGEIDSKYLMAR